MIGIIEGDCGKGPKQALIRTYRSRVRKKSTLGGKTGTQGMWPTDRQTTCKVNGTLCWRGEEGPRGQGVWNVEVRGRRKGLPADKT